MKFAAYLRQRFREARSKRTRVLTFDRETTTGKYMGRKASPFDPMNWIVATGWKYLDNEEVHYKYYTSPSEFPTQDEMPLDDVLYLVGFNIKFDLTWKWDSPEFRRFRAQGGRIWDCQLAQYLLTGQVMNMKAGDMTRPSMNNTARRMGLPQKIDEVHVLWDQGVDTPDINPDLLLTYLCGSHKMGTTDRYGDVMGDVLTTEAIFKQQVAYARELGVMPLMEARMDALMCSTEMEFNGLRIDVVTAEKRRVSLQSARDELWENLQCETAALPFDFNWGSGQQLGALLFGGDIKYDTKITHPTHPYFFKEVVEPVLGPDGTPVVVKSGKSAGEVKTKKVKVYDETRPRTLTVERSHNFPGFVTLEDHWKTPSGAPSTSEETLDEIIESNPGIEFIELLGLYRWLDKDLGTYYRKYNERKGAWQGMLTLVQPNGYIHHNLNHCVTETTRLSSSNPNCQNLPRSDKSEVKRMFVSRFGKHGRMIEIDYSALEVVVKAMLSGDRMLTKDLMDGVDMHLMRLSLCKEEDYDTLKYILSDEAHARYREIKDGRQDIKGYSFASQYGAGIKKMALTTGLAPEVIQALQAAEKARYADVTAYEESVYAAVESSARAVSNVKTPNGYPAKRGKYHSPLGTIYTFTQGDAPSFLHKKGIYTTFYKPEMMNYPTQGDAGAIVQVIMGKLIRHFAELMNYEDQAFLVNTVHDCIWVDAHENIADQVAHDMKRIMENVPRYVEEMVGLKSHVPYPVAVETGANMYDLHKYKDFDYNKYPTPHTTAWPEEYGQSTLLYYNWEDEPMMGHAA